MAFDIQLSDLTNSTTATDGTGVYDVLIQAAVRHIDSQYQDGRITGTDYANVYLGSMQAVLAESVRFILQEKQSGEQAALLAEQVKSEVKNNETGGIIDQQKRKLQEEIDLVIAQTASQYEGIAASQADTTRRNLLNAQDVIHRGKETELVIRQESELELNGIQDRLLTIEQRIATTSGALDSTNKTNADVALTNAQELKVAAEKLLVDANIIEIPLAGTSQRSVNTAQISKLSAETTLLGSRNTETLAETTRNNAESAQRVLLMQAQTTGFKTDAKQKLMRQLYEGYAVNVTTVGEVTAAPVGSTAIALDRVANDILDDLGSTVNI